MNSPIFSSPLQHRENSLLLKTQDIVIEPPYCDGVSVLLCHKKRHFLIYLSNYAKEVLFPEDYRIMFPKSMSGPEKTQAINRFIAIQYKLKAIPIFTIAYASYLLASDERPYLNYEKIARHILNFIEKSESLNCSILSTIIPLSFTKVDVCPDICIRFIHTLVELFGPDVVFDYCLKYMKELDSSIVIDFFANNITSFHLSNELNEKYVSNIEIILADTNCQNPYSWNKLYSVLTKTKTVLHLKAPLTPTTKSNQHLLSQWPKSILSKTPNPNKKEKHTTFRFDSNSKIDMSSDSDEYKTPRRLGGQYSAGVSPSSSVPTALSFTTISLTNSSPKKSPRKPAIKPAASSEDIYELMRALEISPSDDLLKKFKNYLMSASSIPNGLDVKQLFIESMVAFKKTEMQQDIYILVSRLHALMNPQDMLDVYLGIRSLMYSKRKKINISDVDMHYQSFLRLHSQELEEGYPLTLDEVNVDVHNELMNGFELLTQWDTCYAGIVKIYNVLKEDPSLNIMDYFDPIEPEFKSFLITGLERSATEDKFVDLEPTIEALQQRMEEGNVAELLEESMDRLNEKMLDAIAKTSPRGDKKMTPKFVKTPSNVIIRFMSSEDEALPPRSDEYSEYED